MPLVPLPQVCIDVLSEALECALVAGAVPILLLPLSVQIYDDVFSEAVKCGPVAGVAVPVPEETIPDDAECRVYIKYHSVEDAKKLKVWGGGGEEKEEVTERDQCVWL